MDSIPFMFIIIGLALLCFYYIKEMDNEFMQPYSQSYTAGASQRFSSELSSTDQKPYSIPRIQEIKDAGSMAQPPYYKNEDFANLDRYTKQEEELASYLYSGEGFISPATLIEKDLHDIGNAEFY